jgi:hypothetical protein
MNENEVELVSIGELEFEVKRNVTMLVRATPNGWFLIGLEGKDGKLRRFIMQEVQSWFHERQQQPIDF